MGEHEGRIGGERAEHLDGGTVVEVVEATAKRFAIQRNAALPGRGAGGLQQGGVAAERHLHGGGIEALENIPNRRVGGGATPSQAERGVQLVTMNVDEGDDAAI